MIALPQVGAEGIAALKHRQRGGGNDDLRPKVAGAAPPGPIAGGLVPAQGGEDLGVKAFVVHVATRLLQPLGGALVGPEKKVVHVDHRAAIDVRQRPGQGGLARGAGAVDGQAHLIPPGQLPVNGRQDGDQRPEPGQHHPIGRAVARSIGAAVAYRRTAPAAVVSRKIRPPGQAKVPDLVQRPFKRHPVPLNLLGGEEEQTVQGDGEEARFLAWPEVQPAQTVAQGLGQGFAEVGAALDQLLLQPSQRGRFRGDQMSRPQIALIQKFYRVHGLQTGVVVYMLLQERRDLLHGVRRSGGSGGPSAGLPPPRGWPPAGG